jgi:hypothetical protein
MLFYLRNCIVKPAILQIDTFFSMYDEFSTITDLPRIRIIPEVFNIPSAHLKILHKHGINLPVIIFEYDVEFQISPEDRDYLLVQTSGFIPVEVQNELIRRCGSFRLEHEELYGCVTPYPTLWDCEKVTSEDLTMDFTRRFINATEIIVEKWNNKEFPDF